LEEKRQESVSVLLKAARTYARRGVPVFPCEPIAKRPLTQNGHWDATTDLRVIERWWQRWPTADVGVPTGKKSGVVVLDVDVDDGGLESLAKLERAGAPIPKTARARTGGGGIHVFFRNPRGTEIRNSAGPLPTRSWTAWSRTSPTSAANSSPPWLGGRGVSELNEARPGAVSK
jgi:hypothetical protein